MNQGRIIVITGSPGTGKTTTASIVAKESDMDKSVHMHTDDFLDVYKRQAQDKGVQNLCLVRQGLECGGFKEKIREPGEAERLFRLMDIDGICHSSFCGRLEAHFPGQAILYTTCPGLGLSLIHILTWKVFLLKESA